MCGSPTIHNRITTSTSDGDELQVVRILGDGVSATPTSETQTVNCDASGGVFRLSFDGETTADIQFDASASEIRVALEALSTASVACAIAFECSCNTSNVHLQK